MFETLPKTPADPLLALIALYQNDPRQEKIDLGVGVYRNPEGHTPILETVKLAERRLLEQQDSKSYLGTLGDINFIQRIKTLVFGTDTPSITGTQTPGGTGALCLAAQLYKKAHPQGRIFIGTPTWPNHIPVFSSAEVEIVQTPYFDVPSQQLLFDAFTEALQAARPGDAVLLHGCCHNPTGADLSPSQWQQVTALCVERQLIPVIDIAYHGLGMGLEADLCGTRLAVNAVPEAIIATSCSKNFGVYRDRVGTLFAKTDSAEHAPLVSGIFSDLARRMYSMPPDHGAAVVSTILGDPSLAQQWHDELEAMCHRINLIRQALAAEGKDLAMDYVANQRGMFSTLPLSPEQVKALREDFGIYMAGSGRINIAGLTESSIPKFVAALRHVKMAKVSL